MKAVLGGKGANLAEMTNLGVPVPPGFTLACALCIRYLVDRVVPDELRAEVERNLARLEEATGRRFGDARNPLLVSVRSGAPVSMPLTWRELAHAKPFEFRLPTAAVGRRGSDPWSAAVASRQSLEERMRALGGGS